MRTESIVTTLAQRLTPEEIDGLRRRLADDEGQLPDLRASGATTLDDVAEALGLTPEEVRRQLDGLRVERALRSAGPVRRDQRGLLILALVLLASAYPIHLLNPRKLTDEERQAQMEARVAEIRARRSRHPVVHYPIETKVTTGVHPPLGFSVDFQGELTHTTNAPTLVSGAPLDRNVARATLVEAILNAYGVARTAEQNAPKPDHPLPPPKNGPWNAAKPKPGTLTYSVTASGYAFQFPLPIDPGAGFAPEQWGEEVRRRVASTVDGLLDGMARSQVESLKIEPPRWSNVVMPPSGYSIAFAGFQSMSTGSSSAVILPYDANRVARKLEWAVRQMAWADGKPPDSPFPESRATDAKKPVPAYAKVTLCGPDGDVSFELPMTASPEYPTAADAARAADCILEEAVRKAAAQVGTLGPGAST